MNRFSLVGAFGLVTLLSAENPPPVTAKPAPPAAATNPASKPASPAGASKGENGAKLLAGHLVVQDLKTGKDVVLNFANAKLYDVVQQVARVLGLNYVIDPAVKDAPVRLFMNGGLEKDSLLDVLGLALKLHGIGVVRNGDFLEVVPLSSVTTRSAVPLYFGTQPPEITGESFVVAQILPLKFLDTDSFAGFAKEFMSQDGRLVTDKGRNLVIVMDYLQHLRRVLDYAEWMDRPPFNQKKLALFRLKNASPDRLLKELEPVLKAQNMPIGTSALQLVPIQSLNALLLVAQADEWVPEVKTWLDRLDETPRSEEGELFVVQLRFAKAESVYPLLAQVLKIPGGGAITRTANALPSTSLGSARPFGTPTSPLGSASSPISNPVGGAGSPLGGASATSQVAQVVSSAPQVGSAGQMSNGPLSPGASVIVDPDNNALLVFGTRRDFSLIESAVDKLDRMPRQVLIEATILDLSMTGDFEFGFSGFLKKNYTASETNLAGNPIAVGRDFRIDRTDAQSPFTYTGLFTTRAGLVNLILSAKDSKKNVNVVSQPRVWALDNHPARLLVQDQIPIPVNTFIPGTGTGTGSSGYSVTNAQYLDTGLNLTVTPHINGNGVIRLEIQQEISSSSALETLGTGSSAIQAPRISRRSLSTEMIAPSGATVVLGGLVSQNSTLTSDGLPFLNRIPLLRSLFGSTSRVKQKSELVILLTTEVVSDTDSLDRVTMEVRKRVNQVMERMSGLFDGTVPPRPDFPRQHRTEEK